jgi:hypothetical protein
VAADVVSCPAGGGAVDFRCSGIHQDREKLELGAVRKADAQGRGRRCRVGLGRRSRECSDDVRER